MIRSRQTYRPLNMMPFGASIFVVALCVFSMDGFALPEGQNTVAGSVSVEQTDENTLRIDQHSSHAISEWGSFNIDAHESVNVFQPSQSSILLNRILSEDPTQILGNLNANGQVWLMDGAGVMFGEGATVNVGGLLVTTADIENEQFMNGNYRFDQAGTADAAIINEGRITTDHGPVGFFASNVSNRGTIHAKLSSVNLGATETFAIDFYGDGLMQVSLDPLETDQDVRSAEYKVENSGEIEALAGTVEMSVAQGNAVVERMIEQTGAISVDSVGYDAAGNVVLGGGGTATTNISGTISANSYGEEQSGGMIEVQGKIIEIASTAKLSADGSGVAASSTEAAPETRGENGGGTIRIGGEYKGGGDMPTAERTLVDFGAEISANAIGSGDGGEVIVWADEVTHFGGHIDVRGGDDGGHGGFVEVSGKEYLDFQGSTNRSAVNGNAGTLLLDPRNITISAGGNSGFPALTSPFDPNADNAVLNVTTLETELGVGDVIVTTGVNGVQAGNIQVSAAITGPANGSSLSLLAANDITISQDIDMSAGTGGLTITADSDGSGAGTFNLNGGSDLTTNNAQIIITADDMILNGTIDSGTAATSLLKSDGDTIGIASGAGSMGLSAAELDTITAGSLVIGGANAGNITIDDLDGANDLDKITGDVTFTAGAAGSNVTFNGTNSNFSNGLNVNATDGITISNDLVTNGTTSLDADSDDDGAGDTTIGIGDSINTTGNALTITQHDMTLLGTINSGVASTTLLVSNGGTMELGGLGGDFSLLDLTIDSITAGSLTFGDATAGAITIAADVSPANATALHLHTGSTITGTAGGIIEDSLALTAGGLINITDASTDVDNLAVSAAGQTVNFTDTDDVDIDTVAGVVGVTAGTFDLNAGAAVTDAQAIAATNLAVTTTGAVTLDTAANDVDNLAVSAAGQTVSFTDVDDVDIDTVGGVTGVTAGTFDLTAGTTITDAQAIAATNLALTAGGMIDLDVGTTDVDNLAVSAAGQTVNFTDTDDINITTVSGVTGVTATTFDLTAGTTIDDAQAITATNLALTAGGTILLNVGTTDVDNLAVSAAGQTVSFTDADDVDIDMVGGVTGVTATTFNLNTGGAVTDNVASTVAGTTTIAAGAGNNVTLDAATNDFATAAITSGNDVTLVDQNALILGASTISGTLAADAVANLTINGNVTTNGATTLDADSDDDGTGDFLVNGGFTVDTSNNALSVIADDVTLTGNLDSGAATTTFLVSNGGTIDIGAGGGGNLNLTQAEIDNATAAGITIGNAAAGAITVSSDITPANTSILHLHTGSTITGTAGGIIEDSLALTAGGLVDFTDASTDVDNLAVSAAGQTVNFTDTDDITIGTVSGVVDATATTLNLIATSGGAITGGVTVDNLTVDTNSAVLTGTIMGGAGQAAADMITIGGVEGAGPYTLNGFCFGSNCAAPTPDPDDTIEEVTEETTTQNDQETESVLDALTEDTSSSDDLGYFEESGSFDSSGDDGGGASSFASTASDSGGSSSGSNQGLKINGQYVNLDGDNPCPGVKLKAGDTVEAGQGGGCLSTSEGSKLKMDSGTKVNVYKVFYSPDGKENTFFDIPDGSAMFISKPGEHKDEIRTSVPGVTIKVTGTCYIVDHDKVNNQTTMVLFGGGMELYIKGHLLKMKSPIEMVTFGANTNEKPEPVSITMDTVRDRFGESVIPSQDELRACGLRNEDL